MDKSLLKKTTKEDIMKKRQEEKRQKSISPKKLTPEVKVETKLKDIDVS